MDWKGILILRALVFVFALLFSLPALAQEVVPGQQSFRYFIWGVTPADVQKFETAKYYKEENGSLYFLELPSPKDFRRMIRYDFQDGKLWRGVYSYEELRDPHPLRILDIYEGVKKSLNNVYGEPGKEDYIWNNPTYKNYPEYWPRALGAGELNFHTEWKSPDSKVVLELAYGTPSYNLVYSAQKLDTDDKNSPDNFINLSGTTEKPKAPIAPVPLNGIPVTR